jgi:non-specific serine/threonine protein kinase
MIAQLNTFWLLCGYRGEAMDWLRATGLERLTEDRSFAAEVPAPLRAGVLFAAGTMSYYAEHQLVATKYLQRAIELFREPGSPYNMLFYAHLFLSMAYMGSNDPHATEAMREAMNIARIAEDRFLEAMVLCYGTEIHVRAGQLEQARSDLHAATVIASEMPRVLLSNSLHLAAGNVAAISGDFDEAAEQYQRCLAVVGTQRIVGTIGWAQNGLGYARMMQGRVDEARGIFLQGLDTARKSGYRAVLMAQWSGLAWVAASKGDAIRAARILGSAENVRRTVQYTPWVITRQLLEHAHDATASRLSSEQFEKEAAIGAAMPQDAVHALAVQE